MKQLFKIQIKRPFYRVLACLTVYAVFFFPGGNLKAEENIVIGMPTFNFASLPFQVAAEKGFYQANGLKVQHVLMRSDVATAALHSGNVQYNSHFNNLIRATVNGFDMRVVFSTSKQMFSLVVQPEIRSVADLKGKTVGTYAFGALQYAITSRVLKAARINPDKDVTWIVGNDAVFRQQLRAKKIDAVLINPPLSVMMEKEGFKLLLHAADYVDVPMVGLGTTTKKIRENPEEVKKLLRSLYEALQFVRNNREESMQISARWLKMDPETATKTYDLVRKTFSVDGTVGDEGIMAAIEIAKEGGQVAKAFSPGDVADFSLMKAVIKDYEKKRM